MDNEKKDAQQPAPTGKAPASEPQQALPEEVQALKDLHQRYGNQALTLLVLVLVAVAGIAYYRNRVSTNEEQASTMLAAARKPQDLEGLLARYPKSSVAPLAELRLAKEAFNSGNYEGARKQYEDFKAKHPGHTLTPGAEMGRIHCLEALGRYDEARAAAAAFQAAHPDHFLAPEASFVIARCQEQMGLLSEAKATYENFIMANTNSTWMPRAEESLEIVKKKLSAPAGAAGAPAGIPLSTNAVPAFAPGLEAPVAPAATNPAAAAP